MLYINYVHVRDGNPTAVWQPISPTAGQDAKAAATNWHASTPLHSFCK